MLENPWCHSSEAIILAYLMTASDGYNAIELQCCKWEKRAKLGWGTVLGYRVPVGTTVADFVLECRSGAHFRQLAISIDHEKPNLRTATKQRDELALVSAFSSVMTFSSQEVFSNPQGCTERIERHLMDLIEEAMTDDGILTRHRT